MTKLSVIVPNYNHARYLPARLDSILSQTRGDFELLVLDDCSPDNSRDVIRAYAARDPRLRFHFNEVNSGNTFVQWQRGLAMTTGELVWIAESDDVAEPTLLECLSEPFERAPSLALAVANSLVVDEEGAVTADYFQKWRDADHSDYDLSAFDQDFTMDGRDYCWNYMVPWNTIPNASGVLFRRSVLEAIGGPVMTMRLCGDWLTYCKLLLHGGIARVAAPLNHFRHHAVSVGRRTRPADFIREALEVQHYVRDHVGAVAGKRLARVRADYAQSLLAEVRRPEDGYISWRASVAAGRLAVATGPELLLPTAYAVLRDRLGRIARRLL